MKNATIYTQCETATTELDGSLDNKYELINQIVIPDLKTTTLMTGIIYIQFDSENTAVITYTDLTTEVFKHTKLDLSALDNFFNLVTKLQDLRK